MIYSIATVCVSGLLSDKIPAISKAGFHGIELFENDVIMHNGSIADLRFLIDDHELSVVAYQPFRDFEGFPEPQRSRIIEHAKGKLDLANELGSDMLLVCSAVSPQALGGISRAAEDFHLLGELADERGLRIAYEALGWGRHINDYRDAWEIVRRADHPNVGMCLDTFHIFSRNTTLGAIDSIPGDRIFLVQIADAPRMAMDVLSWSRHYRCFPGQGELPLDEFMRHLGNTGYDGPLSLEVFNDEFRSSSVEQTAADGYRSLVYLTERTEEDEDDPGSRLAPAQAPREVAFVEFAIEPAQRDEFRGIMAALGFQCVGRHRGKDVEHWAQQDVHFVLNCEDDSFAEAHYRDHGSSVCAIALEFDDADAVLSRARDLNYPSFFGDPSQDRSGNPAIAGTSESLLYFIENATPSIWERDFEPLDTGRENAYVERIDHISITMSYDEMLRALLLYRAMFGMRASSSVDVYDPGGLIRSQVMRTEDDAVCIALNSSEAEKTLSNRLLARQSGSGVQHIALRTRDIFAAAARLSNAGVPLLELHENYYNDLASRFQLAEEEVVAMMEFGILYDEDDGGRFYQLYTRHFGGRFCFELVQREGYAGFGAANMPIRSAMQSIELGDN